MATKERREHLQRTTEAFFADKPLRKATTLAHRQAGTMQWETAKSAKI